MSFTVGNQKQNPGVRYWFSFLSHLLHCNLSLHHSREPSLCFCVSPSLTASCFHNSLSSVSVFLNAECNPCSCALELLECEGMVQVAWKG